MSVKTDLLEVFERPGEISGSTYVYRLNLRQCGNMCQICTSGHQTGVDQAEFASEHSSFKLEFPPGEIYGPPYGALPGNSGVKNPSSQLRKVLPHSSVVILSFKFHVFQTAGKKIKTDSVKKIRHLTLCLSDRIENIQVERTN